MIHLLKSINFVFWFCLLATFCRAADSTPDANGNLPQDNPLASVSISSVGTESFTDASGRIRKLGGTYFFDSQTLITKQAQFNNRLEFVGISTPTPTVPTNHAYLWLNNGAKQICTAYDNGSSGCLSVGVSSTSVQTQITMLTSSVTVLQGNFPVSLSTNVTGSLSDSRLSSNVMLLASTQTSTANKTFTYVTASTITTGNGSTIRPSYNFSGDNSTGMYYANDSSRTIVFVSSGHITGQMTLHPDIDGGHEGPAGYRPYWAIGPGILYSTQTQLGEGLNVWGQNDGGGAQPQVDIVSTNLGTGDARVLTQGSMSDTPNTVVGYMASYGSGHSGTYWTNGPGFPYSVAFISQAPRTNMFQFITSSQTYFWNMNATHGAYHFLHGTSPTADDFTIVDGTISFVAGGGVTGSTTNDNAVTSMVGYTTSSWSGGSGKLFTTSGNWGDITSVTLPSGGDFLCGGNLVADGPTLTSFRVAISTTSGNNTTGMNDGDNRLYGGSTASFDTSLTIAPYRIQASASLTVYFKYLGVFASGTPQAWARITCQRIR